MTYRFFQGVLFLSICLFADTTPDFSLASVYNEPSVFVEGKVNAITGEFVDLEEDVIIQGAEPIPIHRAYLSTSRKDWIFLPHTQAIVDFSDQHEYCIIRENNGCPIRYKQVSKKTKHGSSIYRFEPSDLEEGFSNTSVLTSLKNNYVIYDEKQHQLTLYSGDGIERIYEKRRKNHDQEGEAWRLLSEHLPNGNWLIYDYLKTNQKYDGPIFALSSIKSFNPSRTKQYAEARFSHEDPKKKNKHFFLDGSDGQRLGYKFDLKDGRQSGCLNGVCSAARRPDQSYEYCKHGDLKDSWYFESGERMVSSLFCGGNRNLDVAYYFKAKEKVDGTKVVMDDKEVPQSNGSTDFTPDPRRGLVKLVSAPRGSAGQMVVAHSFFYDIPNKKTSVYDAEKNRTEYHYDVHLRIQRIESYSKQGNLLNAEQFVWGKKGSSDACNLLCKTLLDQNRQPIYAKRFFYDQKSNLVQEKSYGNLSGKGRSFSLDSSGFPIENGVETYSKEWRYSDGTPNLLLESKTEDGLRISYDYLPGKNLPVRKLTFMQGKITVRQFWVYNEDGLLIREIVDDGGGFDRDNTQHVMTRTLRDYTLKEDQPYLGMPVVVEDKYWDGSSERLLQRTVLQYGKAALVERKDIYDSTGTFRYSLKTGYDPQCNPITETNPLGWEASAKFDGSGNQVYTRDFTGRVEVFSPHNTADRLAEKTCKGFDGLVQVFRYEYNTLNFLISETDPQGAATTYTPNSFGQRIETHLAPLRGEGGNLEYPVLRAQYDAAGNAIQHIDAENFVTQITYNAYASPVEILYPDQSREVYEYFRNGALKSHTDPIGVVTSYERDPLGQVTRKTISQGGKVLAEELFDYKGQKLIAKTDAEGHRTNYRYDGAGRKIFEECSEETLFFEYDELGRNHITKKGTVRTVVDYDLLNRASETREEEISSGHWLRKTVFHYDTADHIIAQFNWVGANAEEVSERFDYDSLGRLISHTDPLGHLETNSYNDQFPIEKNLRVVKKTHTDSMGLQTSEIFDPHGHLSSLEKSKKGRLLFVDKKTYNPRGHLTLQTHLIPNPDGSTRQTRTKWTYDEMGRPNRLIEAEATAAAKVTTYAYTPRGEIKTKTKPNGSVLSYDYNGLGHLEQLTSSDGTVHHSMRYNKLGDLIWSDGNSRKVDHRGRLLSETLGNGLYIENTYNQNGQRETCALPAADCLIEYGYRGNDLTEVIRKTSGGVSQYVHRYTQRDLSGNLLQAALLNNLGQVFFNYDATSKPIAIDAPQFSQQVLAKDPLGNIRQMQRAGKEFSFTYDDLYQISAEQGPFLRDYEHNALHCRLKRGDETYEFNALHQIISHINYDKNGNPLTQGDTGYSFDALDRLIRIQTPIGTQTFQYDALHRRISATLSDGEKRNFLYDGQLEIGSFDEQFNPIELRILGETPHAEIGAAVALELQGQLYAPIHDLSGNIALLLPADGSEPTRYHYTAFGEKWVDGPAKNPWGFSSKRTDPTGLVFYGRRYYQPDLGRWLSCDPAGFIDGMNLYAFVHNNPLTHLDEYGLIDFGQYEPDYQEKVEETWTKLTTPIAHGLVRLSDNQAQTLFEREDKDIISLGAIHNHTWVDQHRPEIANFAIQATGFAVAGGVATRSVQSVATHRVVKSTSFISRSAASVKATPIPRSIHKVSTPGLSELVINRKIPIWTSTKNRTSVQNAFRHWKDHGHEFLTLQNAKQYAETARNFVKYPPLGTLTKTKVNGDMVFYHPTTNTFSVINRQGVPRTMYKPDPLIHNYKTNLEYFNVQQ